MPPTVLGGPRHSEPAVLKPSDSLERPTSPEQSLQATSFCCLRKRRLLLSQTLTGGELGPDGQLVGCKPHGRSRFFFLDTGDLKNNPACLEHRHPVVWRTLAAAHAGFCGFLRHRLVWKNPDPHLSTAAHEAGDGPAGRLYLACGQPGGLKRLQAVLAEDHGRAGVREAAPSPLMNFAVSNSAR